MALRIAFLALAIAAPLAAQSVPSIVLSKPQVELADPFSSLAGVRELRDGRVIAIDSRDKVISVVNFRAGTATTIGREGSGPKEYGVPSRIFALPGDSSAVFDAGNRRYIVVTPDADMGDFLFEHNPGAGRESPMMLLRNATAADAPGNLYVQGSAVAQINEGLRFFDSVSIERFDRKTGHRDTVAYVPADAEVSRNMVQAKSKAAGPSAPGRQAAIMQAVAGPPFHTRDQWAVATDGRVAIVRVEPYRVDMVEPNGTRRRGAPIAHERVRVTDAHKEEWREEARARIAAALPGSGREAQSEFPEPATWPEVLPPFLDNAVSFAPDGLVWIRRTAPAGSPPTFDLVDREGKLARRVVLPKRAQLIAFGAGSVYVARVDDDGLQYLQRYALPGR